MAKWFISYSWMNKSASGFGNCQVEAEGTLSTIEDINLLQAQIEKENSFTSCVILCCQRFEE